MNETHLVNAIRAALSRDDCRLFRNNVGVLRDARGQLVRYGLANGSADLIGWRSIVVTPDLLGRRLAVFVSLEVKTPSGRLTQSQQRWLAVVQQMGGIAAVVRSVPHALEVLNGRPFDTQP